MEDFCGKTDEQLVLLTQQGNVEAFEFLIKRYEDKIKKYVQRMVQGKDDLNDITQNVFLKAFKNIQGFHLKHKFSSWLYRIAHNETVNFLKKKKPLALFDFDVFLPHYNLGKQDIESEAERKQFKQTFDQCLDELESKYKEVVILYYLEELSYQEIADVLHLPVSTVGVRLKRAREALKKLCQNKLIWLNQ